LLRVDYYLKILAALTGLVLIIIALLGFCRAQILVRGRILGVAVRFLRWPFMLVLTISYVAAGILLWRPLPLVFSAGIQLGISIIGSLLYFPGIILYLWGYRTLGHMFSISSGFGAMLYQDHKLIQNGPYRYVRHPMYLAVILAAIGVLLIFRAWAMVLFSTLSLGVIFRAEQEERLLAEEFGEAWDAYKREVNSWIPTLRNRVK